MNILGQLTLVILSSIFWRLGGAAGYDKLWRRLGSTICMLGVLWPTSLLQLMSLPLLLWGCSSYFGWINKFIDVEDKDREYWWNFWAENMVIQSSVLFFVRSFENIIFVVMGALVIALIKVWIDEAWPKGWRPRQDVLSEIWHGGANAASILVNSLI